MRHSCQLELGGLSLFPSSTTRLFVMVFPRNELDVSTLVAKTFNCALQVIALLLAAALLGGQPKPSKLLAAAVLML